MFYDATIDIALFRCETQGGEHVECSIGIAMVLGLIHPLCDLHIVLSPPHSDDGRVEMIHKANQGVLHSQLYIVFGVDDGLWRIFGLQD